MDQYQEYLEIFPTNKMSFERKVNAVIRLILLLSIIGFLITRSVTFLVSGVVTCGAIIVLYFYQKNKEKEAQKKDGSKMVEGFTDVPVLRESGEISSQDQMENVMGNQYVSTTKMNPLSNVLLTDYSDDVMRKPAPPAFNPVVSEDITSNVKKAVQSLNPNIDNTNTQLFGGLYNQFDLEQSNRAFYSTAITTIPNDQGAFASFLYGTMPSGKLDAEQRVKDNVRYLLY
jgi:hypothetical protein